VLTNIFKHNEGEGRLAVSCVSCRAIRAIIDDHGYIPALQFLGRWMKLVQIQERVLRVFLPPTARRIYNVFKIFIQGQINELHLSKHESMRVTMQLDFHLFCSPPFSDFSPSSMAGLQKVERTDVWVVKVVPEAHQFDPTFQGPIL
jgi:hypothetical protein